MSMWIEFVSRALGVYKWNRKGQPLVMVRTKAEQKVELQRRSIQ